MISNNIHDNHVNPQQCQDDMAKLMDRAFISLIHSLIREYGTYGKDGISCWASDFSLSDKKLVLSHYEEDGELLDYARNSPTSTEALWDEHKKHIQSMVDDQCWPVYCDFMEESGARMCRHPNHDEVYWM